jgi:hypothetical protein
MMSEPFLPIDPEIVRKAAAIPGKIADLSYTDERLAIHYLRFWGEHKMPITPLFDELEQALRKEGAAV